MRHSISTRPGLHMGCGEPLCGTLRRLRELVLRPAQRAAARRRALLPQGGRASR